MGINKARLRLYERRMCVRHQEKPTRVCFLWPRKDTPGHYKFLSVVDSSRKSHAYVLYRKRLRLWRFHTHGPAHEERFWGL